MSHSRFVILSASTAVFFLLCAMASSVSVGAQIDQQQTGTQVPVATGMVAVRIPVYPQASWSACQPQIGDTIYVAIWKYSKVFGYLGTPVTVSSSSTDVGYVGAKVLAMTEHGMAQTTQQPTYAQLPTLFATPPQWTGQFTIHLGPFPTGGHYLATIHPAVTSTPTETPAVPSPTNTPPLPLDAVTVQASPGWANFINTAITHGWQITGCQRVGFYDFLPLDTQATP